MCAGEIATQWVGRKGENFLVSELVEEEPDGPALASELVRDMDPNHPDLVDQLRDPEANRKQMGKPYMLGLCGL